MGKNVNMDPLHSTFGIVKGGKVGGVRKQEDAARVVESTFKHFGRIDILVNAAAGNFLVSAEDLSSNGFRTGSASITSFFSFFKAKSLFG